jgi:predicted CXXCH cytochrome family protein
VPGTGRLLAHAALLAACAAAFVAGCAGPSRTPGSAVARKAHEGVLRSNVSRADYVGSAACTRCHADVAAAWARSPMHRMTRSARGAEIRAPFDGRRWPFKDDAVVLEQRGADRFVRIELAGGGAPRTYRVTRVIGGRTREDFAGVDVAGTGEEMVLPVSFVYATASLRYKGYSVMVHERASMRPGPSWSRTCVFCHNTIPEADRLLGALAGPGARPYQGEQVDRWLPEERRARMRVTDAAAFAGVAGEEMLRLGGGAPATGEEARSTARRAIEVVRSGFDGGALIEVGIGCEACHGGSREHASNPRVSPSFVPTAPWLEVAMPEGPAQAVNRACARCHQVLFSRYPYTWEGGRRDQTAGGSHINSGEARDFLLGSCASAMPCTACHDPHGADAPRAPSALATPAGNPTCTACHAGLADGERLRAHSHHDPAGAAGACVACHMPRKNMGLDGRLTRYHRIGAPTDPARVLGDRPLECALCHADKSVGALVDTMEKWWPVRYPRQRLEELYGSLDANVMRATLERGKPHEQAVAIATLGEAHARDAAPLIAAQLASDYPLVREWAARALGDLGLPAPPQSKAGMARTPGQAGPVDEDPED